MGSNGASEVRFLCYFLTVEQHKEVLRRLVDLGGRAADGVPVGRTDLGYASLMICFLLQNLSAAETLLRMSSSFGNEWYPVTVGYAISRTMFEVDVTAHYITMAPAERVPQYINFTAVLNKRKLMHVINIAAAQIPDGERQWNLLWTNHWAEKENEVVGKFNAVALQYTKIDKKGKTSEFQNWSGKTIRQMALEVSHEEAYDIFYSELSSFAHGDVHLADRYLQRRSDGLVWTQKAKEFDVGNVFRHAASFLSCNLELFGRQFKAWTEAEVSDCWRDTSSRA